MTLHFTRFIFFTSTIHWETEVKMTWFMVIFTQLIIFKRSYLFFKITVEFEFIFWRGHDPFFAQFVVLCNIASCGSNWWTFKIIFPRPIPWISKLWLIKNHSPNTFLWKIFYLFCTESLRCSICQMLIGGKGLECDQGCDLLGCLTLHFKFSSKLPFSFGTFFAMKLAFFVGTNSIWPTVVICNT